MKKRSRNGLRFDTRENLRATRLKRFAVAFCCFFVLLAGVSFLLLLKYYDFDLSKIKTSPEAELTTSDESTTQAAPQVSGVRNYLVLCTADDSNELRFAAIITADMDSCSLSVTPLSLTQSVSAAGCSGTFEQQLDFGGEKQLVLAAQAASGVKIDKYVRSRDSGFKSVINYLGGVEVNVEQSLDVRSDKLTAVIGAGEQTMTGDTLLKYLRCYTGDQNMQDKILTDLIVQKLTAANFNRADAFYTKTINLTESDISVLDFASMKQSFQALLLAGEPITVN